jgi:hypothetical protein
METVLACSIRITDPVKREKPWSLEIDEAEQLVVKIAEERRSKKRKHDEITAELDELDPESAVFKQIEKAVASEFPHAPVVTRVKKSSEGDIYFINTNSNYCLNKQGEHGHSVVYYIITPKGMKQKCFCTKPDVQPGGGVPCSKYSSAVRKLSQVDTEALFSSKVLGLERKKQRVEKLSTQTIAPTKTERRETNVFSAQDFVRALQNTRFKFSL